MKCNFSQVGYCRFAHPQLVNCDGENDKSGCPFWRFVANLDIVKELGEEEMKHKVPAEAIP